MIFTTLLGLCAFLVAGSAAYFSVLGIATLFSGSYYQVILMAGALEFGKLVATSYLYRYWKKTAWWLRLYLMVAVITLMGVTSMGIFGYLSAAYQVNASSISQIDQQVSVIESQKNTLHQEIEQNTKRVEMLNQVRSAQEQRVKDAGNFKTPREQAYAAIDKATQEIQTLTDRNQILQNDKFKKDSELIQLNQQISHVKDIGTFKFIAQSINKPLDTVVITFICILICVFDPLAVSLVLAFNVASAERASKKQNLVSLSDSTIVSVETPLQVAEQLPVEEPKVEDSPPKSFFKNVTAKGRIGFKSE